MSEKKYLLPFNNICDLKRVYELLIGQQQDTNIKITRKLDETGIAYDTVLDSIIVIYHKDIPRGFDINPLLEIGNEEKDQLFKLLGIIENK